MNGWDSTPAGLLPALAARDRNNRDRVRELRSLATPGYRSVFDLVPAILHLNSPDLPAYLDNPETPKGLLGHDLWIESDRFPGRQAPSLASFLEPSPDLPPEASAALRSAASGALPPTISASLSSANPGPRPATRGEPPAVESLLLIGSSGSVGHTGRSDLDYWVCYRASRLSGLPLELLRRKLDLVTAWAWSEHATEANFYMVDLSLLERGQVSRSLGQELDGDAAPLLLLEELYRTVILVAGRVPLWLVLPPGADEERYLRLASELAPLEWEGTAPLYVNMGYPRRPEPQEYLAASMWLTCKSEADPFKGILKMIPILEAVETGFTSALLCDTVKDEILRQGLSGKAVDPYLITVDRVIEYADSSLDPEQTDLIRSSAVLKIMGFTGRNPGDAASSLPTRAGAGGADAGSSAGGGESPAAAGGNPAPAPAYSADGWLRGSAVSGPPGSGAPGAYKARVLARWMAQWGWDAERLSRLLAYDSWSERDRLMQGNALLILLFSVYMRISNRLMALFPDQVNAQDEELTPFTARIMGRQRGLEATVDLLPSQFYRDGLSRNLAVRHDPEAGIWSVYAYGTEAAGPDWNERDKVYEAERAVKAAAWLVRNSLAGEGFRICLDSEAGSVGPEAFQDLLDAMSEAFPPVSFKALDPERIWLVGAQGAVLLAFNFEIPSEAASIVTLDAVFRTGWGELRHEWMDVGFMGSEADKCLALASMLTEHCGVTDAAILVPCGNNLSGPLRRAFSNVRGALAASLARAQAPKGATRSLIDL
ncbi:MAG: class I adenylate cyclase [Deltaproteobacteria bacterium]|jgi:adenylate cyclase|nr:class I adenylate cyclase [Deltaproteobacteria bacterium]